MTISKSLDFDDINRQIKRNLSYAYHVCALLGLDDHTYTHLSARSAEGDNFYIYPFGLRFEEVTESNLLKISFDGEVLEGSEQQYNKTGYIIHGSLYKARKDINAIFHIHTVSTIAVSAMKEGLMPISQWALHFYDKVAYHEYNSLALDAGVHGNDLISDLKDKFVMLMRNHGALCAGRTIHEAMFYIYHLEQASKTQCAALATNRELIIPPKEICAKAVADLLSFEKDLGVRDWGAWTRMVDRWRNKN